MTHRFVTVSIIPHGALDASVTIPGSKSCTARALVMAGLTHGNSALVEPADCDDTDCMIAGLTALGVPVTRYSSTSPKSLVVDGHAFESPLAPMLLGNSGTAMRFLCAACAAMNGEAVLDGGPRMRQRPIGDLVDALQMWGVTVTASDTQCPPVRVVSSGAFGGRTRIRGGASSQYLSGLLMAAPRANQPCEIEVEGELVSKPYIDLTIAMMAERGVTASHDGYRCFRVACNQVYAPGTYPIEADASGASYFLAAAAIAGGRVRVANLTRKSHQGDAQFASVLERMGCVALEGPDWIEVQSG
ncbi:MAG: 3-phosphoshikimate 1-carboxyvinyltransferase, partial [Candidatus Hydrogenedentes bacterium]|nr:3-phosphoshikimate 1-carboxyvinyltransferase [Candidatus Hydrogenedentota bacterium]